MVYLTCFLCVILHVLVVIILCGLCIFIRYVLEVIYIMDMILCSPNVLTSVIADSMVPIIIWSQMNDLDIQDMLDNLMVAKIE